LSGVASEVILDKENAIVVPFVNHNAIFKAFIELTSNDDLREKLIANGKKMVNEKFQFETYLKKLIDLYEK
jgi:glycosyltransferase involved in cell wall biosynthesis